uniref:Uncharacterized protein n=1 Tax=Pseudo-nitzschia australis TaxID=44445 RepID=A0A7S4AE27_9STRA
MGLLSELSKSGTSSASSSQNEKKRILGGGEEDVPGLVSASESTTEPEQNTKPTISEPLGAAFLTTTVETIKRKQKQPTAVRNIHETKDSLPSSKPTATSSLRATTNQAASASISGPSTTSTVAPPPLPPRAQAASFLRRTAAPVVRVATTHNSVSGNAPLSLVYNDRATQNNINSHHQIQQQPKKKKKQLSRKRQMEQMLRAGKLDEVEGDHDVQGIAHIYHQQGEHGAAMASSSSSNVRVVPTSSYDATTGSTARSTSVTGRQKTSNQLNSLLANAASLESHRAQNPQFHSMGGVGGTKQGSHRATAKRKYGW